MPKQPIIGFTADDHQKYDDQVRHALAQAEQARKMAARVWSTEIGSRQKPPPNPGPHSGGGSGRRPRNQLNIIGGTIGTAVIGNKKSVTINTRKKVYQSGSRDCTYDIRGGQFNQANIGGTATYNNTNSAIGTTTVVGTGMRQEQLLLFLLELGLETSQLLNLLSKGYSLANLAFSLPADPARRNRMISVLLQEK